MGPNAAAAAPTRATGSWVVDLGAMALLCVISVAWYRDCLLGFFFFDDFWVMRDAARIPPGDIAGFFRFGHAGFELYRPLTTVMFFYALREIFGYDSSGYHAVQLVVFTLNGLLVFAITRRITASATAALAVGILYLLAAGQAVAVYWLAAFTVTGTVFIILLMLWCWLATPPPWRMWCCAGLQVICLLASEHAMTAPVLLAIVTLCTQPRPRWRRCAIDLVPALLVVAAYGVAKLVYFARVRRISSAYSVGLDVGVWLLHLGQYALACFNVTTLLRPGEATATIVGAGLVALLALAACLAVRRSGAWPLLAGGLAFFVVSLAPVFPLRTHYKDHYVGLAAFGMGLAVVAVCQLITRRWRGLAASIAAGVLLLDVATAGRAWRDNPIFRLVVGGSKNAAAWVGTLQQVALRDGNSLTVFVPRDPTTSTVFSMGEVQRYFPSLPGQVVVFNPGRLPAAAANGIVIHRAAALAPGRPLPGWEPRWAILRRIGTLCRG